YGRNIRWRTRVVCPHDGWLGLAFAGREEERFIREFHMSRINTNVSSLIAQRVLRKNNDQLNQSLQRLSTGLRINSGADDPAGLIASENLKSEQLGITQAIDNANRANNIVGTAEGGLSEVSNLLT